MTRARDSFPSTQCDCSPVLSSAVSVVQPVGYAHLWLTAEACLFCMPCCSLLPLSLAAYVLSLPISASFLLSFSLFLYLLTFLQSFVTGACHDFCFCSSICTTPQILFCCPLLDTSIRAFLHEVGFLRQLTGLVPWFRSFYCHCLSCCCRSQVQVLTNVQSKLEGEGAGVRSRNICIVRHVACILASTGDLSSYYLPWALLQVASFCFHSLQREKGAS